MLARVKLILSDLFDVIYVDENSNISKIKYLNRKSTEN